MGRFFSGYSWRFIFTTTPSDVDPGGRTTTWANGLVTARLITLGLNQPSVITCAVWGDNRNVNAIDDTDHDPLVAQSNRIIYALRREAPADVGSDPQPPWVCRAAGVLMSPQDQADADVPLSHLTAYDGWGFLAGRPCRNLAGALPGPNGFSFLATRGDVIATTFLRNTILNDGFAFIDAGEDWGGTSFYNGNLGTAESETDAITFNTQKGTSVADVWNQLCASGNMDIVLTPIYDPVNRPGYTHELNIYRLAGASRPSALFGWDTLNRCVTTIDRMHDGTPGNLINRVQYWTRDGAPVPVTGPLDNTLSINKYLVYMAMQTFPDLPFVDPTGSAVLAMAQQALTMHKQGLRTLTLKPTPERSPIPLIDYNIGDRVPVHATNKIRSRTDGELRVNAIPISIDDNGIETIGGLLLSPDFRTLGGGGDEPGPPLPPAPYEPPGGAVTVSNSSELIDELTAETPQIVLEDGTYDNPTPFLNPGSSSLYAENIGGAVLTAGVVVGGNDGPGGAVIQGLAFDVTDPDKSTADAANACINAWGATADNLSVLDCTFDGHYVVAQGLYAINPEGLTARRLVLQRFTDEAIRASDNTPVAYHAATPTILAITDINIDGVTYPTPGGSGGTAEAGLWIGHPVVSPVARIKIRNVAWSGIETVNNSWDTTLKNLDIDMTGPNEYASVAVYCEHFSLHNIIEDFVFVAATGVNCEWDNDIPGNAGAHFLIVRNGTISSAGTTRVGNQAGVYADQGTESTTVQHVTFLGQNWAAIGAYLNTGTNVFTLNDYSGIAPGAVPVSTDHI